ncbi:MAG TPA: twin-arginine translocase TatA/TatE family subunit [Elusimicrobia bacterium]|nr:twin-arginine translocase TatA/TatE family subunit [Elusimicrobiota bacterium]
MPNIGYGEILLIAIVAILLFGANKIPDAARALGRSVNAFKSGLREGTDAPEKGSEDTASKK